MAENQGPITQDQLDIAKQFEESARRAAEASVVAAADSKTASKAAMDAGADSFG